MALDIDQKDGGLEVVNFGAQVRYGAVWCGMVRYGAVQCSAVRQNCLWLAEVGALIPVLFSLGHTANQFCN